MGLAPFANAIFKGLLPVPATCGVLIQRHKNSRPGPWAVGSLGTACLRLHPVQRGRVVVTPADAARAAAAAVVRDGDVLRQRQRRHLAQHTPLPAAHPAALISIMLCMCAVLRSAAAQAGTQLAAIRGLPYPRRARFTDSAYALAKRACSHQARKHVTCKQGTPLWSPLPDVRTCRAAHARTGPRAECAWGSARRARCTKTGAPATPPAGSARRGKARTSCTAAAGPRASPRPSSPAQAWAGGWYEACNMQDCRTAYPTSVCAMCKPQAWGLNAHDTHYSRACLRWLTYLLGPLLWHFRHAHRAGHACQTEHVTKSIRVRS